MAENEKQEEDDQSKNNEYEGSGGGRVRGSASTVAEKVVSFWKKHPRVLVVSLTLNLVLAQFGLWLKDRWVSFIISVLGGSIAILLVPSWVEKIEIRTIFGRSQDDQNRG